MYLHDSSLIAHAPGAGSHRALARGSSRPRWAPFEPAVPAEEERNRETLHAAGREESARAFCVVGPSICLVVQRTIAQRDLCREEALASSPRRDPCSRKSPPSFGA